MMKDFSENRLPYFKAVAVKSIAAFLFCLLYFFGLNAQNPSSSGPGKVKEVIPLGPEINSKFSDYASVITADGEEMFFTSRRPFTKREKKRNKASMEHIYRAKFDRAAGAWVNMGAMNEPINEEGRHNSNLALSNDGQQIFLYRDNDDGNGDIYISNLKGKEWSKPKALPSPVNSEYHESSVSLSPDGRTLFFISDRPGGLGGRDIWFCSRSREGVWDEAKNLGAPINTKEDEEGIFIHPDGKTLYFSSKGHGGFGSYDLFVAEKEDGNWGKPRNLGGKINTPGADLFYVEVASGEVAYYSSSQKGRDDKDIFMITYEKDQLAEAGPKLTIVKGIIADSETGKPLPAKIEITDNATEKVVADYESNSATGKYLFSLPSGKNYGINVNATDYLFYSENLNLPDTASYNEVEKNIELVKIKVGEEVVLRNIFFDYGKASLKKESEAELKRVLAMLLERDDMIVEIAGHTDDMGSDDYNLKLSRNRAKAVVDYLHENGVEMKRLKFKGYGEEKPMAGNDTEEGRKLNRRVSFKIVEYQKSK